VTPTPPPMLNAPRPRRLSEPVPPLAFDDGGGRIGTRTKFALAGLALTAFSCGMMFMVAVDRFWPRARPLCEVVPAESVSPAYPATPAVEVAREPATPPASVAVAQTALPAIPADPVRTAPEPAAVPPPAVEPMPMARPVPAAKLTSAPAPAPHVVRAPAPAPRAPSAAPAPVARGRATITARKRPAPGAQAVSATETLAPTESWNDPFAR
jgi:protein TonB